MSDTVRRCCRRWLILIVLTVTGVVAVVSLAVTVLIIYRGGSLNLAPGDVRLLTQGINNFFCQAERIQLSSIDKSTHFNASVVPGDKLGDKTYQTMHLDVSPTLEALHGRAFWRVFLPSGSRIRVLQCTTDITGKSVMSFIFKGHDIDEDCIKHVSGNRANFSDSKVPSYSDKSCNDIILDRYLVRHCGGSKQRMDASIAEDDYYLILYDSISPDAVQVIANISMTRYTYDRSSSLANCSSTDSCLLPLRFGSSDTVIGQVSLTTTESEVGLKYSCVPRSASFAIVFAGLPLFLILLGVIAYYCVCKKRRQKNTSLPHAVAEPINEESERKPLIDEAEVQPAISSRRSYGATEDDNDPILSKIGPIPGPYQYVPTAPPTLPPELNTPSDEEDQPFAFPREPPPTYEETVRPKKQKVAELC